MSTDRESLQRAQAIARLGYVTVAADGRFASWSDNLAQLLGSAPPSGVATWLEHVHPDDRPAFLAACERGMGGTGAGGAGFGGGCEVDYRIRHGDGRWVHLHQAIEPLSSHGREAERRGTFWTLQDVTTQRIAEQQVRESELRFRQLAETIEDVLWIATPDLSTVLYLSPGFDKIWGRARSDMLNDPAAWLDSIHPDDRDRVTPEIEQSRSDPAAFSREYRIVRPDGSIRWILNRGFPVVDASGRTVRVNGVATDISERRRNEATRRQFEAIVASSDDAIVSKTLQGVITSWNPGAERLFGYTAAEAVGQSMLMLIPPDRLEEEPAILARLSRGESVDHFETVRVRMDGKRIHISATISPIRNALGEVVGASKIARDITERRQGERRLQEQLGRLSLLDQITAAIGERQDLRSIYNVAMRSIEERLPAAFCCILTHEEGHRHLLVDSIGAHSRGSALSMALSERESIPIDGNGLARCIGGTLVYEPDLAGIEFSFPRRMRTGGLQSVVLAPLASESRVFGVLVVARTRAEGFSSGECEFLRQLSAHIALAAQQARLFEALQEAYDELRQTQQAVMQQERLRALGQMASGIAHDINNAISPVLLYAEALLEHESKLSDRSRRYLQTISQSIEDVGATVSRLREFYRQREPQFTLLPVDLNELVGQVAELTRARWRDMALERGIVIRMEHDLAHALPKVEGVESELREALLNLVLNATDAMPTGGTLTLRTRLDASPGAAEHAGPRRVHVEVADTGSGMDEDTRRRCLEPFFTTKGERGTGLGLAMVYGIAQRHGADIEIDSHPGRGTSVSLSFAVGTVRSGEPAAGEPALPLTVRFKILIIDDDPIVLQSLRDALETDGHVVVSADGGNAGIGEFMSARARGASFDAVVTDLGMPYVDGRQVAVAVKRSSASTPVLMLTGWGQRMLADEVVPPGVDRLLAKPPKLRELRSALIELVTAHRASVGARGRDGGQA